MSDSPRPPDEARRQAALDALGLRDRDSDPVLEAIVRRAAALLDAPIALVSLVDGDRQWWCASVGTEMRETPRELSFCAHAILGAGVFAVPDATRDARFRDNPLVRSAPGIRSYIGAPLTLPDGQSVGTLCLVDLAPRRYSEVELELLYALRDQAVERLVEIAAARRPCP